MRFESYAQYLECWSRVLDSRLDQAVEHILDVDGVVGLVVAGSLGRGEAWPLSDIDLLPVYGDSQLTDAKVEVEKVRATLLERWQSEGFRTALDVGTLGFSVGEVERSLDGSVSAVERMIDERWFHSIDKGYKGYGAGRTRFGEAMAQGLAKWFTAFRFSDAVQEFRVNWKRHLFEDAVGSVQSALRAGDAPAGGLALCRAVDRAFSYLLESWHERDSSMARSTTRFESAARRRASEQVSDAVLSAGRMDPESTEARMACAPAKVVERHSMSFAARTLVGERVSVPQDARDCLWLGGFYERRNGTPLFPPWVGLHTELARIEAHLSLLSEATLPG